MDSRGQMMSINQGGVMGTRGSPYDIIRSRGTCSKQVAHSHPPHGSALPYTITRATVSPMGVFSHGKDFPKLLLR